MSDAPPLEDRPVAPLWTILALAAVVAAIFYAFHLRPNGGWTAIPRRSGPCARGTSSP
jgi:hypothetical protein